MTSYERASARFPGIEDKVLDRLILDLGETMTDLWDARNFWRKR